MDEIQVSTEAVSGDDWDDITFDDLTDDAVEEDEGAAAEAPEADQPTEEQAETGEPETEETEQEEDKAADQLFELKHLDEVRSVGREEVIALAQKGMDYDRIREKYDAAKPGAEWYAANADTVKWLEDMAKNQGMSLAEMVDETRAEIMAKETNQSVAVCRGIIANERKALELEAQKKALDSRSSEAEEQANAKAKMEADVQAFVKAYPEAAKDPNSLPKEVWDEVHKGESLVNAYRAWENKQLKAQLDKEKKDAERRAQEQKNKARSTGSQSTAGNRSDADAFDAAWYDGS